MSAPAPVALIPVPSWLAGSRAPAGAMGSLGVAEDVQRRLLIARILQVGGSGDRHDLALVRAQIERLPTGVLRAFLRGGGRVVVCRSSVVDYKPELKEGGLLRGWDPGTPQHPSGSWDGVPGGTFGNEVVISVIGHGTAVGPRVPERGEGPGLGLKPHGSANVVFHEMFHVVDGDGDARLSHTDAFVAARAADEPALPDYERQPDRDAALQETFAESAARYYENEQGHRDRFPNLVAYWDAHPPGEKP